MKGIVRPVLDVVSHHLRQALRALRRSPGTSGLAVVSLACGLGLAASMFSLVDGLLLRGLPFADADRYMYLESTEVERGRRGLPVEPRDFLDWRRAQTSFEYLVAFSPRSLNLADDDGWPERRGGCYTTHEFFAAQPVRPVLGRGFSAREDTPGAAAVAVIGHQLWTHRYAGDPNVLGRVLRVDGEDAEIIGVMPPGFKFPLRQEIWLPLRLDEEGQGPPVMVFGKLRQGMSRAAAQAEVAAAAARLAAEHPETHAGRGAAVMPYTAKFMWQRLERALWTVLGLVVLGLLIACANVASLLAARALGRRRELAIRGALGASRARVAAYVLNESLVLSVAGAAGGLVLARLGAAYLARQMAALPVPIPFWMVIRLDLRTVGFLAAATVMTIAAAGLYPAWKASRIGLAPLADDTRSASSIKLGRFLRLLVAGEVAVACLLLVFTGLFVRTLVNLSRLDLGAANEEVLTARLSLPGTDYPEPADRNRLVDELTANLAASPQVVSAQAATSLPTAGFANLTAYGVEDGDYPSAADYPRAHRVAVTPGFFDLFAIPVVSGRRLEARDRAETQPVAVVSHSLARRAWPQRDAVGQRLRLGTAESGPGETRPWLTVVGLVPDAWAGTLGDDNHAAVYVPYAQTGEATVHLAVAGRDPRALADLMRQEVRALDPGLPLDAMQTMSEVTDGEMFFFRLFGHLMSALGLAAMLFAALGIYGVNAFSVHRRTAEIGVRMALGAERGRIVRLIVGEGARRLGVGLGLGLGAAAATTRFLGWTLFQVEPRDPATFAVTALFVAAVALLACFVPARRAARVAPVDALRCP